MRHLIVSFTRWNGKAHASEKGIVVAWDSNDTSARYAKAIVVCDSDRAVVAVGIDGLKGEGWRDDMGMGV